MTIEVVVRRGRHEARLVDPRAMQPRHVRPASRWRAFWAGPGGTVTFIVAVVLAINLGLVWWARSI